MVIWGYGGRGGYGWGCIVYCILNQPGGEGGGYAIYTCNVCVLLSETSLSCLVTSNPHLTYTPPPQYAITHAHNHTKTQPHNHAITQSRIHTITQPHLTRIL